MPVIIRCEVCSERLIDKRDDFALEYVNTIMGRNKRPPERKKNGTGKIKIIIFGLAYIRCAACDHWNRVDPSEEIFAEEIRRESVMRTIHEMPR